MSDDLGLYPDPACPYCGGTGSFGNDWDDCECMTVLDPDEEEAEWIQMMEDYELEHPKCGCPFCYCTNTTIAGEKCDDCLAGAHQG